MARNGMIHTGMPAMQKIAALLIRDCQNARGRHRQDAAFEDLVSALTEAFCASADVSVSHGEKVKNKVSMHARNCGVSKVMELARSTETLATFFLKVRERVPEGDLIDDEELEDPWDLSYHADMYLPHIRLGRREFVRHGGTLYYEDPDSFDVWMLSRTEVLKLHMWIQGIANHTLGLLADGVKLEWVFGRKGATMEAISAVEDTFTLVNSMASLDHGDALRFADMWKQGLAYAKILLGRIKEDADAMVTKSYTYGIPDHHVSFMLDTIKKHMKSHVDIGLGYARAYRMMTPGDNTHAEALLKRYYGACYIRTAGDDACKELRAELIEVLLTAHTLSDDPRLPLRDPENKPVWWGEYLSHKIGRKTEPSEYGTYLAWEGTGVMEEMNSINPEYYKDSGCPEDTFEEAFTPGPRNRIKRKMLLRMCSDPDCPTPGSPGTAPKIMFADTLKKPEPAKERIAYSSPLYIRFKQSRTERTLRKTMRHHPSFAIGKSGPEADKMYRRFNAMPENPGDPGNDPDLKKDCVVFLSTDVSGWSERLAGDIQATLHAVCDEYYGTTLFSENAQFTEGARVMMNAGGYRLYYTNGTADFEGYRGFEYTLLNIAASSRTVKDLRTKLSGLASEARKKNDKTSIWRNFQAKSLRVILMSYIDDAATRLQCRRKHAAEIRKMYLQQAEETWARWSMLIDARKSFPSDSFWEFLGNNGYQGRMTTSGSKAMMRINAEVMEEEYSLTRKVAKLSQGVRGAVSSGLDGVIGTVLLSYMIARELTIWIPKIHSIAGAFFNFAPHDKGGLACPGLLSMTINGSGASAVEAMSNLHQWFASGNNATVRRAYMKMVREGVPEVSPGTFMRTPMMVGTGRELVQRNPVADFVKRFMKIYLNMTPHSPAVEEMISYEGDAAENLFAESLFPPGEPVIVHRETLKELNNVLGSPLANAWYGRFSKAETLELLANASRRRDRTARSGAQELAALARKSKLSVIQAYSGIVSLIPGRIRKRVGWKRLFA